MGIAIYSDWQNIRATQSEIKRILQFAEEQGSVAVKCVCAQWRREKIRHDAMLHQLGFDCLHVPDGKDNADQKLIDHCRHQVETLTLQTVILISDDGGFVRLIRELKLKGIRVIVIGTSNCNKRLKNLAHEYYSISNLVQQVA